MEQRFRWGYPDPLPQVAESVRPLVLRARKQVWIGETAAALNLEVVDKSAASAATSR